MILHTQYTGWRRCDFNVHAQARALLHTQLLPGLEARHTGHTPWVCTLNAHPDDTGCEPPPASSETEPPVSPAPDLLLERLLPAGMLTTRTSMGFIMRGTGYCTNLVILAEALPFIGPVFGALAAIAAGGEVIFTPPCLFCMDNY